MPSRDALHRLGVERETSVPAFKWEVGIFAAAVR